MAPKLPTEEHIAKILGKYSIASVRTWLKSQKLTHTANSRADLTKKVYGLVEKGKVELDTLIEGLIGIEEAASKVVHVFTIVPTKAHLTAIDKQLKDLGVPFSDERAPAAEVTFKPKLVYAINTDSTLRVKWAEKQTRVTVNRRIREFKEVSLSRLVVFVLDKATGLAQLRYDKPFTVHSHKIDGLTTDQAYFDHFREAAENMIGLPLNPKDLRSGLRNVLLQDPPIVIPVTVDHFGEDGGTNRSGHLKRGGDPRKTDDWKRMHGTGKQDRTYEGAPMRWIPEMTNGKLSRPVFSAVDGKEGSVRFDADCHEAELEYVLAKLV